MSDTFDALAQRVRAMGPGVADLVAEAEATWLARAAQSGQEIPTSPGWRPFEDAFPTFFQFTNRPPR
ncbi:MAG TPA: multiple cyclophane-containing RiPP AmcA [Micromonosporaceae bacterium]|nr:multiple cyclophane-containing RiPP AmcA [Micromonosporaceae bacterium]